MTKETSCRISNLSLVCALLVVLIHVGFPSDGGGIGWFCDRFLVEGLSRVAVPFFFVVSGYFLSRHFDEPGWHSREVRKRVGSLLVPGVLWIFIGTALVFPVMALADHLAHRPFGFTVGVSDGRWVALFGLDPRHGPTCNGALWYVRALFLFVLCSPVLKTLVVRCGRAWLAFAYTLNFIHAAWRPFPDFVQGLLTLGFPLSGVFYFSLGIYLERFSIAVRSRLLLGVGLVAGGGLLVAQALASPEGCVSPLGYQTLAIPFLLYVLWHLTPETPWPNWLTRCSFPIFLLHTPLIPYFFNPLKHTPLAGTVAASGLTYACVVSASIALAVLLKRFAPNTASFLFAGRG